MGRQFLCSLRSLPGFGIITTLAFLNGGGGRMNVLVVRRPGTDYRSVAR